MINFNLISVGQTVFFEDANDAQKRHAANYRGLLEGGSKAVVLWNGQQIALDAARIFAEDLPKVCGVCDPLFWFVFADPSPEDASVYDRREMTQGEATRRNREQRTAGKILRWIKQ